LLDKRDSLLDASNGYYVRFESDFYSKAFGSDLDFVSILADLRYIKTRGL
jgi:hypothetical protein